MDLSDRIREIEYIEEAQHHNTKVRSLAEKVGSRKIRLTVQETKKMIENMLNEKHPSPSPKTENDRKVLEDCKVLAEQMIPRLKEVKERKGKKWN